MAQNATLLTHFDYFVKCAGSHYIFGVWLLILCSNSGQSFLHLACYVQYCALRCTFFQSNLWHRLKNPLISKIFVTSRSLHTSIIELKTLETLARHSKTQNQRKPLIRAFFIAHIQTQCDISRHIKKRHLCTQLST